MDMILTAIIIISVIVIALVYQESLLRARRKQFDEKMNEMERLFNETLENIRHHDWLLRTGLIETAYLFTEYGSSLTEDVKKWTR
ncbi:hypothetical protein LCGC14_1582230 [marine sediment metagenome]|uniref:Uncharacterized protein n=1 Tax=marine sediment metagenome TaxID=412755 RepID=A0A0F9J2P4_9ZZZZ